MATSIVGGCGLVDELSGMAATSAVIFFTSASVSFLEVTHGRLLDACLLDGVDDQFPRGRPEPGFQAHLLECVFDLVVPQVPGPLLREVADRGVVFPRDARLLEEPVQQPPQLPDDP